ncbi:autotransporter adhesin, partial [Paraburkholderia sp. GAS448]
NVDGRVTTVEGDVSTITNNLNSGTIGLVQQSGAGANLTVGKDTDGAAVDFTGTAGSRVLTGVAAGALNASSVDAVNGSQLFATNTNVTNLDNRVTTVEGDITTLNTSMSGVDTKLADAVKYDSAAHDSVTLGIAGTPVQLTNVRDGALNASSVDAVNGSQLFATNQQVAQNTTDITTLTNTVNSVGAGLVQQSGAGANLTVGKDADGAAVDFTGTAGSRVLTGVAAGALNASSVDAVNGSQLFATNTNVTNLDNRVTKNEGDITGINTSISNLTSGTAGLVQQSAAGANLTVGKDTDGAAVDFTGTAGSRVLTGVAAGTADTQAVNVSQLKPVIAGLGGGASIDPVTGAVTGPTYSVTKIDGTSTTVNNAGDAITTIDARVSNVDGRVTTVEGDVSTITNNLNSGTIGLVQQSGAGANLTVGKDTDGAAVDFTGTAGS